MSYLAFKQNVFKAPLLILCLYLTSCGYSTEDKKYTSYHAESEWTLKFQMDGSYILTGEGHVGSFEESGKYIIYDNTYVLFNDIEDDLPDEEQRRLYRLNSECLISRFGQEFCRENVKNELLGICDRIEDRDSIIQLISKLPSVIEYIEDSNIDSNDLDNLVGYLGTVKSQEKVLDVYGLSYWSDQANRVVKPYGLRYYFDRCNKIVYEGFPPALVQIK